MRSPTEESTVSQISPKGGGLRTFLRYNRKLHYYLGLFLLFFIWLFALSGLLLNHSQWKFAEFWEQRRQSSQEREFTPPGVPGDLAQARDLMRQFGIRGEIEWTTTRKDTNRFDFRVSRPGMIYEVQADFARRQATIREIDLNAWGVLRILHTFTGVRSEDTRNRRDWFLTSAWAWSMDLTAAGLILIVLSSFLMWLELPPKRRMGLIALCLGVLSCGLFCFGLRWFY